MHNNNNNSSNTWKQTCCTWKIRPSDLYSSYPLPHYHHHYQHHGVGLDGLSGAQMGGGGGVGMRMESVLSDPQVHSTGVPLYQQQQNQRQKDLQQQQLKGQGQGQFLNAHAGVTPSESVPALPVSGAADASIQHQQQYKQQQNSCIINIKNRT